MSNIDTTDYTFSNIDWSALPLESLLAFGQTATAQPAAPTITMTPQEAEAAAAMALGQPTGRPAVEVTLPEQAAPGLLLQRNLRLPRRLRRQLKPQLRLGHLTTLFLVCWPVLSHMVWVILLNQH